MITQEIEVSRVEYFAKTAHSITIYLDSVFKDDGVEIARSNANTSAFTPDKLSTIQPWIDGQVTKPNTTISAMANALWTPAIIAEREAWLNEQKQRELAEQAAEEARLAALDGEVNP